MIEGSLQFFLLFLDNFFIGPIRYGNALTETYGTMSKGERKDKRKEEWKKERKEGRKEGRKDGRKE